MQLSLIWFSTLTIFFTASFSASAVNSCMHTFERFAYEGIRDPEEPLQAPMLPWERITDIADEDYISYVALARDTNNGVEVWLKSSTQYQNVWIVYSPQSSETEVISAELEGTNFVVDRLFVDNVGTLWGSLAPTNTPYTDAFPVLGRFNETERRFELIEYMVQFSSPVLIEQTSDGILWFLVWNDGLYAFDPEIQSIQERADFNEIEPDQAAVALDDTLYFSTSLSDPSAPGYASLQQVTMYHFNPQTDEMSQVDLPQEWPVYRGLLIDRDGRLWLGAIGFRSADRDWHLQHPDPERYMEWILLSSRTMPSLMFESSDGRLWYTNWWDGGIWHNGTAWYDPATGEGCMFTNMASSVVEDSESRLWLAAYGELYRYTLNSQ